MLHDVARYVPLLYYLILLMKVFLIKIVEILPILIPKSWLYVQNTTTQLNFNIRAMDIGLEVEAWKHLKGRGRFVV